MQASAKPHLEQLEHRNLPAPIAYHGGPVLQHVKVEAIFDGIYWTSADGIARENALKTAITNLIGGSYMDQLVKLSSIGRGSLDKVDVLPTQNPSGPITGIVAKIKGEITLGHVPAPGSETLYVFFGAKGHSTQGGEFHSSFIYKNTTTAYYAVVPFNFANGVPTTTLQSETFGLTHEIVEAATDPHGNAWYFANGDELCDRAEKLSNGHFATWKVGTTSYAVSPYWLALPPYGSADAYFASLATAHKKHELNAGVASSDFDD